MSLAAFFKLSNLATNALATVTAVSVIGFSGYMVYDNYMAQNKAYGYDLLSYKPSIEEDTISMQELYDLNPDICGWITIEDTHIDYPIVHSDDDLYYVNRDATGQPSLTGSIYLQAKNETDFTDSYNLLYGHHVDGGAMFGDLSLFRDADFFKKHTEGTLITLNKAYSIDIIACISTNAYCKCVYDRTKLDKASYEELIADPEVFVMNQNARSLDSAVKYLALSTCYGVSTDGRTVVICKITEIPVPVDPPKPDPKPPKVVKTGETYQVGWGIINVAAVFMTLLTAVPYLKFFKDDKKKIYARLGFAASIVATVSAALVFFRVEELSGAMMITDRFTFIFLLFFGVALLAEELITKVYTKKNKNKGISIKEEKRSWEV